MDSLSLGIFDEIVGFHSGFFKKTTKFVWTRSFSALKLTQLFTLNIDPVRAIQTQCIRSIKLFSEQNTYLRKEENNNESEIENKE